MQNHLFIAAFHVCRAEEGQTRGVSTCSHASGKALPLRVPFPVSPAAGEDKSPSPGWAIPQRFSAPHTHSLEPMKAGPVRVSNVMFSCYYTELFCLLNGPDWAENLPWLVAISSSWLSKADQTEPGRVFFSFVSGRIFLWSPVEPSCAAAPPSRHGFLIPETQVSFP